MLNLNRAQVLGNLTRDPEMRFTPNGQAVSNFTVATNRRWKSKDGQLQEATEYHDIVVWGKQAENVSPMLSKGTPALVEGRLQTRNWEGQDGVKRYRTEIIADSVIVLGGRGPQDSSRKEANPLEDVANTRKSDQVPADNSKNKSTTNPNIDKNKNEEEIDIEDIPF